MPRGRIASPQEVQAAVLNALAELREALVSPKAPKVLERWLNQIAWEWWFWHRVLELRRTLPRSKFVEIFTPNADHIARECGATKVTQADLAVFTQTMRLVASAISAGHVPATPPAFMRQVSHFFSRQAYATLAHPRRPKSIYINAYVLRAQARAEGRPLTAAMLAERLTSDAYHRNPENAIRNMQRGLKRAEREYQRCAELGIPLPPAH